MANKVSYGPHLFPDRPEHHIRTGDSRTGNSHDNIVETLKAAFSCENPNSILSQLARRFKFDSNQPVNLSFMNYGNMQLVYLVTIGDKLEVATLINQPHTPLGKIREEFDNLARLVEIDPRFVVEPLAHFTLIERGHELYASEYINNAMCVAVHNGHGLYDPLPYYHFETFSPEVSSAVNAGMIALLVNYYDSQRRRGLAKTQISGDDFILTRDFRKNNSYNVQANMKLIAARGFIEAPMEDYLNLLRREFLIGTNREDVAVTNGKIRINTRSKLPMTSQDIEKGIEIGLELRR